MDERQPLVLRLISFPHPSEVRYLNCRPLCLVTSQISISFSLYSRFSTGLDMAIDFARLILVSSLYTTVARADITPTAPAPNDTFLAGSDCTIQWGVDRGGSWTNVTIGTLISLCTLPMPSLNYAALMLVDLVSGSNANTSLVTNVASGVDGTNFGLTPYNWTCPEVEPYSAIYFYQVCLFLVRGICGRADTRLPVQQQGQPCRLNIDDSFHRKSVMTNIYPVDSHCTISSPDRLAER